MARDFASKGQRLVQTGPTILANPSSSALNQWFGRTTIASAAGGNHFIAAGPVTATAIIDFSLQCAAAPGSESLPYMVVRTINTGSGFVIGPVQSYAGLANSYIVNWRIDVRA